MDKVSEEVHDEPDDAFRDALAELGAEGGLEGVQDERVGLAVTAGRSRQGRRERVEHRARGEGRVIPHRGYGLRGEQVGVVVGVARMVGCSEGMRWWWRRHGIGETVGSITHMRVTYFSTIPVLMDCV